MSARRGSAASIYGLPYGRSVVAAVHSSGAPIWGLNRTYAVNARINGRPLRIERDWHPVPVPPEERSRAREGVISGLRMTDPSWQWTGPDVPADKSPRTAAR